jgi:hypothetical protein
MDDRTKAAFASATEVVKNTLTLSTAVLTVSVTFAKDLNKNPTNFQAWVLEASWAALLLAVVCGVMTLMALTGTLAQVDEPLPSALYDKNIQRPMATALFAFLAGIALTAGYGMLSV